MLDYPLALTQLLNEFDQHTSPIESTPLSHAQGQVLAQDVKAQFDSPMFDNSAMDGYALFIDPQNVSLQFTLVGRIAAGDDAQDFELQPNQAVRIFTGAPIPQNANAVIAQEQTQVDGETLLCLQVPKLNQHIRRQAEDIQAGTAILLRGQKLSPAMIGLAASQGLAKLPTHAPVRVTVFSSGNELREPDETHIDAAAIFDANRYQLMAWLQQLGCIVTDAGILPDRRDVTQSMLEAAAQHCDLILTSGGVSVGEEDHLKAALEHIGTLHQWKLLIKPGKPFAWGSVKNTRVIMLPGNPVSTFVTFKMLVEPAIRVLAGQTIDSAQPKIIQAKAQFSLNKPDTRREFLRGILSYQNGQAWVQKLDNQGSHMLSACALANVLIEIKPQSTVASGQLLNTYPI